MDGTDRVLKVGTTPINTPDDLQGAIVTARGPVTVAIHRRGEPEPRTVSVEPDGKPWRLGFTFLADEAEPGTVVLNYVVPGTPAARAGLEVGDRVYRFDGQAFSTNDELLRLAAEADDPIPVLVERQGRLETIDIRIRDLPPRHGA